MRFNFAALSHGFSTRTARIATSRTVAALLLPGLLAVSASGQNDPPAGYYATATGTGATLKSQLHNIIDGHTVFSYNALRSLLQQTDAVPGQPGFMDVVYDTAHVNVAAINPNGSIPGWDSAATWNREHTWPRSRGVGSSGPDNSDMHQLRPSLTQTNSDRGSLSFGGAFGSLGGNYGTINDGGLVWYPGDEDAGRMARAQFYMAVRYDGSDSSTTNLELSNSSSPGTNQLGKLNRLLEWHYAAPVDDFERIRNDRVYGYQDNRNPFVDRPEYVWSVFADNFNDSQLSLVGGSTGSDGGSQLDVDFGRVIVGANVSPTQSVTLSKSGLNGTYYEVTTTGDATSSVTGRYNAFATNATGSEAITVGLNGSTATPGSLTGSVTIDNLDITTGLGSGFGAFDADDTINLSLDVLDHANPSFSLTEDVSELTIDLGQVSIDTDVAPIAEVDIANFGAIGSLMADLRLTSVVGSGDTGSLFLFPTSFDDLAVGNSRTLFAGGNVTDAGEFAATFTLAFVDENLPGAATLESLTLNLLLEVLPSVLWQPGDFDDDGIVAQGDLNLVLSNWGQGGLTWNDRDIQLSDTIDQDELNLILSNWGEGTPPNFSGFAVPEPAAGLIAILGWVGVAFRPRRS
ncbi:MAG: endonuclease [Planctomycetota bacterium]